MGSSHQRVFCLRGAARCLSAAGRASRFGFPTSLDRSPAASEAQRQAKPGEALSPRGPTGGFGGGPGGPFGGDASSPAPASGSPPPPPPAPPSSPPPPLPAPPPVDGTTKPPGAKATLSILRSKTLDESGWPLSAKETSQFTDMTDDTSNGTGVPKPD